MNTDKTFQGDKRIGEIVENTFGSLMEIVEYKNCRDMYVKFLNTGEIIHASYLRFKNGEVRSAYDKSEVGVGYMGEGSYKGWINKKPTPQYSTWHSMLNRCYHKKTHERQPYYKDCYVTEEWHNFQNFAKWFDENYYSVEGERIHLDKDILYKGNKLYSPDNCIFVPQRINTLFTKKDVSRGNLPIGVTKSQNKFRKYLSYSNNGTGKQVRIGSFHTQQEAFMAYKEFKENLIKEVANEYKEKIPRKLFNAMINYEVEITD